jgi:hypothetical protein
LAGCPQPVFSGSLPGNQPPAEQGLMKAPSILAQRRLGRNEPRRSCTDSSKAAGIGCREAGIKIPPEGFMFRVSLLRWIVKRKRLFHLYNKQSEKWEMYLPRGTEQMPDIKNGENVELLENWLLHSYFESATLVTKNNHPLYRQPNQPITYALWRGFLGKRINITV